MEDKASKNIESDEVSVRFDFSRHHAGSEVPDLLDSQDGMKTSDDIPPLSYWRRSEAKDVKEIYKLFRVPYTREMFGIDIDVNRLVELSYISLSQFNTNEQLVAFISFCDYPNVPSVPSFCWLEWIHSLYRLEGVTTCNSLFIHLVVWSTNYANTALKTLLAALFMSHMRLKYVIMVVPPGATTSDIFDEYFTRICPIQLMSDFSKIQTLYICMRHQFVSELKIRLAMEEDNDDLMAIFNDMNHEICDKYGEYFFAELCIYGGSNRRIIVAEDNDRAIGIMCLNNDVNVSYLNENFELKPFNGLRKPWADTDLLPKQSKADAAKKSFSRYEGARSFVIRESKSEGSRSTEEEQESKIYSDSSSTTTGTSKESIEVIPLRPSYTDMTEPDPLFATVSAMYMSEKPQTRAYDLENQKSWELEEEYLWLSKKGLIPTKKKFIERVSSEVCEMSNAFAVELYGLHKHYDERMSYDFLTSAFECFPYLDYCIITLPSTSRVFPLLQHFVRVSPKSESTFQHELYVAHRNSILCEPIIQEATKTDAVNIQYLLEGIQGRDKIYIDYLLAMNSPCHIKAFVFTNETTIVGLAIIRQVNHVSRLRATYSLDKIVEMKHHGTEQHGVIQHLVVSPIFQNHGRYFLKELHRLTGFTCLYYQLHSYEHDKGKYSIPSLLGYLIPVSPRQQVKFDFDVLGKNAPDKRLMQETVPYPLYHMNHRLSSHTKLDINTRIVIVGGTNIALAFIEHLIFGTVGSNFNVNNLSLVSRHGVFTDHTFHPACEHFIPYNGHFNFTYLSRLHLQTWVNIIYGNMTAINRDKKFIKVNDESILYYDYLFLFCEEKFLKPNVHDGLEVTYHPEVCHNSMNCREEVRGPAEYPKNVFVINTPLDASFVLQKLHEMGDISQLTGHVIVYGHSYHAFCCIAALIEFGIPGKNISFVEPFPDYKAGFTNTIFNNEEVDEAVINSIHEEGIVVYSGYFFHSWSLGAKDYSVQKVTFTKRAKVVSIDCIALFYYPKKSIEQITFQAFREACLLFDGKLIIDHTFCTNDPSIFAAGNFTKYSDRYYSEPHSNFNPVEIGIEVANQLLKKLYHHHENVEEQTEVKLPPRFFSPIIISCILPGSINYLHIRKPGLEMPMEAAISKSDYGKVYITGSCKNPESGYFRLHLDSHRFVRTITCYTKKEIDIYNLTCLYGKHERLLNNFVLRFENKLIPDLFQYFRQAWCYGIFHDYFHKVQKQNIDEISSIKGFSGKAIIEEIGQYLKQCDWKLMPDEKKEDLYAWYSKSHLRQGVEQRMTTFLQDNIDLLPMYAAQRAVNRIFHMAPTSQLLQFSIHRN